MEGVTSCKTVSFRQSIIVSGDMRRLKNDSLMSTIFYQQFLFFFLGCILEGRSCYYRYDSNHNNNWRYRGWVPKFATGLIYQIGHTSKSSPSAKMIPPWVNHFGKITAWSLIYFLNYAQYDILTQSQILVLTLYL